MPRKINADCLLSLVSLSLSLARKQAEAALQPEWLIGHTLDDNVSRSIGGARASCAWLASFIPFRCHDK